VRRTPPVEIIKRGGVLSGMTEFDVDHVEEEAGKEDQNAEINLNEEVDAVG